MQIEKKRVHIEKNIRKLRKKHPQIKKNIFISSTTHVCSKYSQHNHTEVTQKRKCFWGTK